jgi:hypothetical protein
MTIGFEKLFHEGYLESWVQGKNNIGPDGRKESQFLDVVHIPWSFTNV